MFDQEVTRVLAVLERAQADGCPVATPSDDLARVAVRRWQSFANRRIRPSDRPARIEDLAKGLMAYLEDDPALIGPLKVDYRHLAGLIADELERDVNPAVELLIEGYRPDELLEALDSGFETEVLGGRPLVAQVGTAQILMAFRVDDAVLVAEVAHVDGGGEGVLPLLISLVIRFAKRRQLRSVEWHVLAATCARPNPRLRPILERCGFVMQDSPRFGKCYFRKDAIRT